MKKLILFSFFIALSVLMLTVTPALAAEELWSKGTSVYKVQREGNNITLTNTTNPVSAGIPSLVGTINGTTFTGKQYLRADSCPNFEGYVPANGTVSADGSSITVTFISSEYYTSSCTIKRNFEDSYTYTKIGQENIPAPSVSIVKPSPSPTPTEAPLNLNGTWTTVNEMGTSFTFSGRHSGNSLTLQITDVSDPEIKDSIGKTSLSGTLSGHAFSGTQLLIPYAPECLGKYFNTDGAGTVAANGSSITVAFTNFKYNTDTCAKIPGSEFSGSVTYVRTDPKINPAQGENAKQSNPSPKVTKAPEEPSVGVSSKDFQALARANAQYQKAQADLEAIKKANDPRYEAKKDFAREYNSKLDEAVIQIAQEQNKDKEDVKDSLKIARTTLERIRDAALGYGDIKDVRDVLGGGKFSYGGVSLVSDVTGGITDVVDLMNEDVSAENAIAKVVIDTVTPNALYAIPVLKAADMVLNIPDKILSAFGVDEKNWYRENSTGFLKDHSVSGFIKTTTKAMVKTDSWENVDGALQIAWNDVKEAEGFGEKAKATLDLVGTAVGAVPVAIAIRVKDGASALFTAMQQGTSGTGNYIVSWFTFSN